MRMNSVFQALAHEDRRRILDIVKSKPDCCVQDICQHFSTSRIAVMKHLKVLEKADLLGSEKVGRQRIYRFNVIPIQLIYDRWSAEFSAHWARKLTKLKYRLEDNLV